MLQCHLSLSRCCMLFQISRPGAPAMTALLRDLLPLSSSCSTRSKPSTISSVASKHSTSTSMYRPPYASSRNGRMASPARAAQMWHSLLIPCQGLLPLPATISSMHCSAGHSRPCTRPSYAHSKVGLMAYPAGETTHPIRAGYDICMSVSLDHHCTFCKVCPHS